MKMYFCHLCGQADKETFKQAREGKMVVYCQNCQKPAPSNAYTLEKDKTGKIKKVDFLEKLLSL